MIHTDDRFANAVADAVAALERRTDAEVVVVAAARSGTYADLSARVASVGALAMAGLLLAIPWHVGEPWFLADVAITWWLVERACRAPWILRRLASQARRQRQVSDAAATEMIREAVHGTPHRTGVLVYVSSLEGMVEVLPDLGVQGRVPGGALQPVLARLSHDDLDAFLEGLAALGDVLAAHLPHTEHSDAIDLPNAPRIRP